MIQLGTDIVDMPLIQAVVKRFKGRYRVLKTAIKRLKLVCFASFADIRAKWSYYRLDIRIQLGKVIFTRTFTIK